ncbi:MAG: TolC family protein [Oligoflexia bacterium]|nr:TolC family protein [Oligoflexia bacterium]MBF0364292.1 TolC family protein [Oligoflexia bacterium]
MKKIKIILPLWILLFFFKGYASDTATTIETLPLTISLSEAIKFALAGSESQKILQEKSVQAKLQEHLAITNFLPKLTLSGYRQWQDVPPGSKLKSENNNLKMSASESLFRGGSDYYQKRKSELLVDAAHLQQEEGRATLTLQVAKLYISVLMSKADLNNLQEELRLLQLREKELQTRVRVGRSRLSDLLTTKAQAELILSEIEGAKITLQSNLDALALLVDRRVKEIKDVEAPVEKLSSLPPLEVYLSKAREQRSALKSGRVQIAIADRSIDSVRSAFFPSIDLQANYYLVKSATTSPQWDLGLYLSMPLFDGGVAITKMQEATSMLREEKLQWDVKSKSVEQEVRSAYEKLQGSLKQQQYIEEGLLVAKKAYSLQEQDYERGLTTLLEVLQIQNTLLDYKKSHERIRYQILLSRLELQVAAGEIL